MPGPRQPNQPRKPDTAPAQEFVLEGQVWDPPHAIGWQSQDTPLRPKFGSPHPSSAPVVEAQFWQTQSPAPVPDSGWLQTGKPQNPRFAPVPRTAATNAQIEGVVWDPPHDVTAGSGWLTTKVPVNPLFAPQPRATGVHTEANVWDPPLTIPDPDSAGWLVTDVPQNPRFAPGPRTAFTNAQIQGQVWTPPNDTPGSGDWLTREQPARTLFGPRPRVVGVAAEGNVWEVNNYTPPSPPPPPPVVVTAAPVAIAGGGRRKPNMARLRVVPVEDEEVPLPAEVAALYASPRVVKGDDLVALYAVDVIDIYELAALLEVA